MLLQQQHAVAAAATAYRAVEAAGGTNLEAIRCNAQACELLAGLLDTRSVCAFLIIYFDGKQFWERSFPSHTTQSAVGSASAHPAASF